jgi:hypothetical protein
MGDRGPARKPTLATAVLPRERPGLLELVKQKIVGRLLLDGGTVEQPRRSSLTLDVPRPGPASGTRGRHPR